jgi:hypothetical protein
VTLRTQLDIDDSKPVETRSLVERLRVRSSIEAVMAQWFAMLPMPDQPQVLRSRPFSVSPVNSVVRSPASVVFGDPFTVAVVPDAGAFV